MNKRLIAGGCGAFLLALGFVFPQIAEMRLTGSLGLAGVVLLLLGVTGTLAAGWCIVLGMKGGPSTPAS